MQAMAALIAVTAPLVLAWWLLGLREEAWRCQDDEARRACEDTSMNAS